LNAVHDLINHGLSLEELADDDRESEADTEVNPD